MKNFHHSNTRPALTSYSAKPTTSLKYLSVISILFCCLWGPGRAQEIQIRRQSAEDISLQFSGSNEHWYRLERSLDLQDWVLEKEALFGQVTLDAIGKGTSFEFYRTVVMPSIPGPYIVGVVGDSTAAGVIHGDEVVSGGWAEGLRTYIKAENRILNAGQAGLSSRSFLFGRMDRLKILQRTEPPFVFIQFGQIDQFSDPEEEKFTQLDDYRANLIQIVRIVREWEGIPILVTPLPWRVFDQDGIISSPLRKRSDIVLEVAHEVGAYAIDLHRILATHYQTIGSTELRLMSAVDQYHLSEEGAIIGARLLVEALPDHLRRILFDSAE